jgi:hypothetical protein
MALGVFFGGYTLLTLDIGTLVEMGPGYFPLCLSSLLTVLGVGVLLQAGGEGSLPRVSWRAVLLITAAPVVFGLTVRSVGLLPALLLSVSLAVVAGRAVGWWRGALIVLGVSAFCIGVFKLGLQIPFDLVNPALLR